MVLTTVPSAALPVQAANGDVQDEVQVEAPEVQVEASETTDAPEETVAEDKKDNGETAGETTEPEDSSDEDVSEDEQIDEEGEDNSDEDMVTEEKPAEMQEEQETVTEESEESEDEEPAHKAVTDIETNALEKPTNTKILIRGIVKGEDGADVLEDPLKTAEVLFTNNTASSDGTQVRADSPITFRVLPADGNKIVAVKVGFAENEEDLKEVSKATKTLTPKDDIYTIEQGDINKSGDVKYNALLAVQTEETKFTVKGSNIGTIAEKEGKEVFTAFTSKDFAYGDADSIEFYLKGAKGTSYKVTATAKDGTASDPIEADDTKTIEGDESVYLHYSLNAFNLNGIKKNENQDITINVETLAAVKIAGTNVTYTEEGYPTKIGGATIPTEEKTTFAYDEKTGSYNPGDTVVFSIAKPAQGSVWAEITTDDIDVALVDTDDNTKVIDDTLSVDKAKDTITQTGATVFAVTIPEEVEKSCTLKLTVNAKLNDSAKTITFVLDPADSEAVTIKSNGKTLATGDPIKTEADKTYPVTITSKEGYQLTDISVQVNGIYAGTDGGNYVGKAYTLENSDVNDKDYPRYAVKADIALTGKDTPEGEKQAKDWTATAVTVTIKVSEVEGADEYKEVTFESTATNHPYAFTVDTDETVKFKYDNEDKETGTAKIKEGTKYLNFTVKSESKPEITVQANKDDTGSDDTKELLEVVSETSGEYKYRVAAKAIIDTKGKIIIDRPFVDIEAEVGSNATITYSNAEDDEPSPVSLDEYGAIVDVDAPLTFEVTHEDGMAPISTVTYTVGGKDAAEQQAQSDGEGNFFFEVKATKNIAIKVTNAAEERLFVNGEEVDAAETMADPLGVDYEDTITACLMDDKDNKVALLNATVYDGSSLAETVAEVKDNAVTLKVAKKERASVLTVTLLKKDRTAVTFKIASDKAVEEVTYEREDGTPVSGNIEMSEDTTLRLRIKTTDGSMGKVHAVVSDKANPEKITNETEDNKKIAVEVRNGYLEISAYATEKTIDNGGTVLLYEEGDGETILKGSPLSVKVNEPIVKRVTTTTAGFKSADARNITISITVPEEFKNEKLNNDYYGKKLYYIIKVNAPSLTNTPPEGFTGDWKETKDSIERLGKNKEYRIPVSQIKGGWTIPVIEENVTAVKLDGFTINVTPAQTVAEKEVLGTACDPIKAGTMGTVYTDTLKLKADAKELITGQDKDVPVAALDFATITEYRTVTAEIVDSTTGIYDDRWHDEDGYESFEADWDAVNERVIVNAAHATAWDNAQGIYKNLAVKVTAYTEKGDYGVSGVQKLKVVNGIESISLSVQPEIRKTDTKKAVTAKSAVTFNDEKTNVAWAKKTAPKSKVVEYSLANVGAGVKGHVKIDPKKGQITVDKDFLPSEKADNSFDVVVEAKDYAGNMASDWATVTVTTEDSVKGELAIFEAGTNKRGETDWSHAKKVTQGSPVNLQVKETTGQYRLAMLKPTVPGKTTYDLTDDKDFVDLNCWNIKYTGKNISLSSEEYSDEYDYWYDIGNWNKNIVINKLGKITFTLTAKSNNKHKADLKNINFVLESTDLYVGLTRYNDSTFYQQSEGRMSFNDSKAIEVKGNSTNYYKVELLKKVGDGYQPFALSDGVISVKNGKKVTPIPASDYKAPGYVMATGTTDKKATVISVKSKSAGKTIAITINNPTAEVQGAAPKLALANKKLRIPAGEETTVDLTVTAAKKGEVLPENTYVMLSADHSKKTKAKVDEVFAGYLDRPIPISKTGVSTGAFSVKLRDKSQVEGYTLIATLGTLKDGVFTQSHKEARITLKAVKGNINIKATSKYTLNPYGISSQKLVVSGGDYDVDFASEPIVQTIGTGNKKETYYNYAQNVIQKENGKPNEFNKYFFVDYDDDGKVGVIKINPTLEAKDLANIGGKDFLKKNGTGYITVTNGKKVVDIKLTVAINGKEKLKLKATAASVIAGKDVITDIQIMNGKTPVALGGYDVDGAAFKKYYDEATKENTDEYKEEQARRENGIIRVKAADVSKGKSPLTTLRVLPAGLADAYSKVEDPLKEYGIDITNVSITVNDDKANKVTLAAADKKWKVENSDWAATAERNGWATEKTYTFSSRLNVACVTKEKDSGQEIKVTTKTPYVTFKSDKYNASGKQTLEIFLDKAELDKAIESDPKKVNYKKTVKVDAIFSYPDKADATKGLLKEDKVTFNITLPAEKSPFGNAGELTAAVEAIKDTELQEMADVKTSQYYALYSEKIGDIKNEKGDRYTDSDAKNDTAIAVAKDLKAYLLEMAKGTAAFIDATGKPESNVYKYTLSVADKTYTIETIGQADIEDVVSALSGYLGNIKTAKNAADLGIKFKPVTTDEELTQNLYKVLEGKKVLTNNITLSATVDTDELKAPTTLKTGDFYASVTITDRNREPGNAGVQGISYEFPMLTKSAELTDLNAKKGLKNMLGTDGVTEADKPFVGGMTKLEYFFSESYKAVPTGIDKENKISPDMLKALKDKIKDYADTLVEKENPYLSVKEIEGFKCEPSGGNWNVEFTIIYTDISGDEAEDITVELTDGNMLTVTETKVPRLQTPAQLKTDAGAAFAARRMLLDTVDTAKAAGDAVRAIITSEDVCLNPNYDEKTTLIVTADEDSFVKPDATNKTNGQVTVTVDYDGDKAGDVEVGTYTFVVLYDNDLKGETPKDPAKPDGEKVPNLEDKALYEGLIKAALSEDRLNKITQDAWEEFAKADGKTEDNFVDTTAATGNLLYAITKAVETSLKGHGEVKLDESTGVTLTAGSKLPKGSADTDAKGAVKEIKVKVMTAGENSKELTTVTISETELQPNAVFQSEKQFIDAVKTELTTNGIGYNVSFFTTEEGKTTIAAGANQTAVTDAITARAKATGLATNPLWSRNDYLAKISAEAITDQGEGKNTDFSFTNIDSITIKNVKLTIGDTAEISVDTINVPIKAKSQTELVEGAKFTMIGSATVSGGNGSAYNKAVEITAATGSDENSNKKTGTAFDLKVQKKLTNGTAYVDVDPKDVLSWTVKAVNATTGADESELPTGIKDEVTVKDGVLFVSNDAYAAKDAQLLKLTATVKGEALNKNNEVATAYVKLTLTPSASISLKVGNSSKMEEVTGETMSFEAPADSSTAITFAAEVKGSHIATDGTVKAAIAKPEDKTGVTFTDNSGNTTELVMNIASTVTAETPVELNITGDPAEAKKVTLTIVPNKNATEGALSFPETSADETYAYKQPETDPKHNGVLTVKNTKAEPVKIEILGAAADRIWDTTNSTVKEGKEAEALSGVSFEQDKKSGKLYLVVDNSVPEKKAEFTPEEGDEGKVPATTWTMTLKSTASPEKGQAAITKELAFDIVVVKTVTEVTVTAEAVENAGTLKPDTKAENKGTLTLPGDGTTDGQLNMAAEVKGAHVNAKEEVTWKIISKYSKSRATIDAEGVLTVPQGEGIIDNTITVQATSKAKMADGKPGVGTYTIKVVKE